DGDFVAGIDLDRLAFDPDDFARRWAASSRTQHHAWSFDSTVLERFPRRAEAPVTLELAEVSP
ncbi:MAG: hypothetical protein SF066_15940, partial [Thermoanaerobaculia bacterium]|nr:hypothetical protein [Thermoanaerobaculia bacterium]